MGKSNASRGGDGSDKILDEQRTDADELKRIRKYNKVEKLWLEADRQASKAQMIFEEVDQQSKEGFSDLPPTNPTMAELQNPDYAHRLYYKQLRPLLGGFVPKGKDGKEIRDQVNLFLKEGKRVGRDGRQAYTKAMVEAVNIVKQWVNQYKGSQLVELYYRFRDLNKKFVVEQKG